MNKELEKCILETNDKDLLLIIRNNFTKINILLKNNMQKEATNKYNNIIFGLKEYFSLTAEKNIENNLQTSSINHHNVKKLGIHPAMRRY